MFSSGPGYPKLKTNLKLSISRLKLLGKKKTEMALKNRKEIADYMANGKTERAKIRVEHIIREDYYVEAMEIVEMHCDLLTARFGLIQSQKNLDDGLAEAISSLIWVTPRLQADVPELKVVSEQLIAKYGKPYGLACRENAVETVSEKLMHKLSVQAPPKLTVEKYLVEIAKYYNVEYEPDTQIISQDEAYAVDALVDLAPAPPAGPAAPNEKASSGNPPQPFHYPQPPPTNQAPYPPPGHYTPPVGGVAYPTPGAGVVYPPPSGGVAYPPPGAGVAYPPPSGGVAYPPPISTPGGPGSLSEKDLLRLNDDGPPPYENSATTDLPKNVVNEGPNNLDLPELPVVPSDTPTRGNTPDDKDDEDVDFDDLTRRFEALKKKK